MIKMSPELEEKLEMQLKIFCNQHLEFRRYLASHGVSLEELQPDNEKQAFILDTFQEIDAIEKSTRRTFEG